jgi:hypothetical protein
VVPVIGKGQFSETAKLFRLMGKAVFVLSDLDGLADDNYLVNLFQDGAQAAANERGLGSVAEMDRSIRDKFNTLLDQIFQSLEQTITRHRYWANRPGNGEEELKAKRRATLAALLTGSETELKNFASGEFLSLRKRYDALLETLASAGCVVLRRGTIEDYYLRPSLVPTVGKPEVAVVEMERTLAQTQIQVRLQYDDVIRAIEIAAPLKPIDENALLREQLGSLLGAALQIASPTMKDVELNARAAANFSSGKPIFRFTNRSVEQTGGALRRVEVQIESPLFKRDGFPFVIDEHENLTSIVRQKLPSP